MQPCEDPRATTSILLVDDDVDRLAALETILAPLGHHLVAANSSLEALTQLSRNDFALVVLDLEPAEGLCTAAELRARPRGRKTPLLFISAAPVDGAEVARAYAQGAIDFIVRPFDPRLLRSKAVLFIEWHLQSEESKRRLAAVRRRDRQRYEEQTTHRVRNLTDGIPLCVWAANREGRITYTNKTWTEYTGLTAEESHGHAHLAVIHPDDRERVAAAWANAVASATELVLEYRLRRASDGAYRWHLGRGIPERGPRGAVVGWIATATDIDDQKHAQTRMAELAGRAETARVEAEAARAEAEAARAVAEQASRMKDEFLATVSHELRTPLNAIYGWTRMMRAGELDGARVHKAIATIERNTKVQIKLVEDLLDVSRIVSGKLHLELSRLSPSDVVRMAVEAMVPAARAKQVELKAVYDPSPCRVSGDPSRLQQVVWNLLANALKFTPSGGRVEVVVGSVEDQVEIEVSDTGHGIPPEFLPHVFDPFRQADGSSTRSHGGLGLGLAIVKHIVELHAGSVEVHSEGAGRGARFVVKLPLAPLEVKGAADWTPRPSESFESVPQLTNVRVLVVDDDDDARDMLAMVMQQFGATVVTASCAAEAMSAIEADPPDVLLSDIGMPGEDGYALIARVRRAETKTGAFVPAIALTGYATAEDGQRALAAGFQLHMPKPIDPAELLLLVGRLLLKSASTPPGDRPSRGVVRA